MSSVRVAVRVRPLSKREKQLSSKVIINMKGNATSILKASPGRLDKLKDRAKTFLFDYSYDSSDTESSTFASQETIFQDLGTDVLKAAFEGFNVCMFAYGQTGSGKTHTMLGHKMDKGLIPRLCEGLFLEISNRSHNKAMSFYTEVSYLEIYNERVHDLLKKRTPCADGGLKVKEHPKDGPYVENLSKHEVQSNSDMESLINMGSANRTIASTGMNECSSRSHTIFTISFTQAWFDADQLHERLSKINLVDLAGSERAEATHVTVSRLKESATINKSLVTLGSVISALADLTVDGQSAKKKQIFIPYRDSVLTWLLKDCLGGNSVTTMIATISPADANYMETLNTLRFASRAKNIMNTPTVNEDGAVKVIKELEAEVTRLQKQLAEANKKEMVALRKEGSGVVLDCQLPYLILTDENLLCSGIVLYYLKEGRTMIGCDESLCSQDIMLKGCEILHEHCVLENSAGTVTLLPQDGALCFVNGSSVTTPCQLTRGAVIQLGRGPLLRFNHPAEVSKLKEKQQSGPLSAFRRSLTDLSKSAGDPSQAVLQNSSQTDVVAEQRESRDIIVLTNLFSAEKRSTAAIPEREPVPHTDSELDGDLQQGRGSIWDSREQEREWCHKSGPGPVSESPQRKAQSRAGVASYTAEQVLSGGGSHQQSGVLGLGDGCGIRPGGNANEIHGVETDGYKGRPDSSGSSLEEVSHLQKSGGRASTPGPSRPRGDPLKTETVCCSPGDAALKDQFRFKEMKKSGGLMQTPQVFLTRVVARTIQKSGLGSLLRKVSGIVQDAQCLLWSTPTLIHKVKDVKLPSSVQLSRHVASLVRESKVLSVVKDSHVVSMVKGSLALSLIGESHMLSAMKELPLVQHIQMNVMHLLPKVAPQMIQECTNPDKVGVSTQTQSMMEEQLGLLQITGEFWGRCRKSSKKDKILRDNLLTHTNETEVAKAIKDGDQVIKDSQNIHIFIQTLIDFPGPLLKLQYLPIGEVLDTLKILTSSVLSVERIKALQWLDVAKFGHPVLQPGLLILMEDGLYAFTTNSEVLVLYHHLPLVQLREMHVSFAGQSLCLMGTSEESILVVYSHSQKQTKELSRIILDVVCPGDRRASKYPLLHADLMKLSLDSQTSVPDLLLDAGLRLSCGFQRSLADLVYLLYCNMGKVPFTLGEVHLLLYTSVSAQISHSAHAECLAQFFLTDTHFGLVREAVFFHPDPCFFTSAPFRPRFHDLTLCLCSDVRCILLHEEDESGSVRLDLVLTSVRARGHPESVTKAANLSEHPFNSAAHAEAWKLTFSSSTEATCLINHLSNV